MRKSERERLIGCELRAERNGVSRARQGLQGIGTGFSGQSIISLCRE